MSDVMSEKRIEAAVKEQSREPILLVGHKLASRVNPNDAHVGVGDGELHLYVISSKSVSKRLSASLGDTFGGYPLKVEYIGKVKPAALAKSGDQR